MGDGGFPSNSILVIRVLCGGELTSVEEVEKKGVTVMTWVFKQRGLLAGGEVRCTKCVLHMKLLTS